MSTTVRIHSSILQNLICCAICFFAVFFYLARQVRSLLSLKWLRCWYNGEKLGIDGTTKVVVITGCDSGFGKQLVAELMADSNTGYAVVALVLQEESVDRTLQQYSSEARAGNDRRLWSLQCDVTSDEDIKRMQAFVQEICSGEKRRLYAIVNNAGIANAPGDFMWFPNADLHILNMNVNYCGMLRVTAALQPLLVRQSHHKGGRVINISSVAGAVRMPRNSAYAASKFAVEAWSDALAMEYEPWGLHVVKIRPGQFATAIQASYFGGCVANFEKASAFVQELYGGREQWLNNFKKSMGRKTTVMSPPQHVAILLKQVLDHSRPPRCVWAGPDAHTFFRALTTLPHGVATFVFSLMFQIGPVTEE